MPRATAKEGDVVVNIIVHDGLDEGTFRRNAFFRTSLEQYAAKASALVTSGINERDRRNHSTLHSGRKAFGRKTKQWSSY